MAARFNGARGAAPVTIDGELGAAWIHAGSTKVAFVFHVNESGLVHEVELIADPDVLATMEIVRVGRVKRLKRVDHIGDSEEQSDTGKGSEEHEDHDV